MPIVSRSLPPLPIPLRTVCGILATLLVAVGLGTASSRPLAAAGDAPQLMLVMIEEAGCGWCARWNREIGTTYAGTPEGRRAPLRRIDMHEKLPPDLAFLVKGGYTPTFVLVEGDREVGRIRGYPGEDFFWGYLESLLAKLPPSGAAARPAHN